MLAFLHLLSQTPPLPTLRHPLLSHHKKESTTTTTQLFFYSGVALLFKKKMGGTLELPSKEQEEGNTGTIEDRGEVVLEKK